MLANRVKETTATTGTGSFTTSGAVAGFQTFNTAFGTNRRFTYWAVNDTNNEWETGIGYLSASTTLVRETVLDNSSGGTTAINFTTAPSLFSAVSENALLPGYGKVAANTVYTSSHHADGSANALIITANRAYYVPFLWGCENSIDTLCMGFSSAAGTKFRLGIYEAVDGLPTDLIASTSDLTQTSGVFETGSITSMKLPAGWYFLAFISDGADTIYSNDYNVSAQSILGIRNFSTANYIGYMYESIASWTALPSTVGSLSYSPSSNIPRIMVQVA